MKQTILFIHGFRGNSLGLKELASKFPKKDYDVRLINIPPAGGKSLPEYSARLYARFVGNYIKKNKLDRPVLVGHSMGSLVAAAVAERYPEKIAEKIVFLAPISTKPSFFFAALAPLTAILPNKLIGFITTKYLYISPTENNKSKSASTKVSDKSTTKNPTDKNLVKILKTTYDCGADYTSKADVFKAAKFSVSCAISDFVFKKKAIFISGEHDKLIPREKTDQTAKALKAKTIYIKNAGHLLNYEQPSKTASAIKNFLKK